ncbi:MAG: Fic family protein [Phycisphaerales bacterium JB040]
MKRSDFTPQAPGVLVPTSVMERTRVGADPVSVEGLAFLPDELPPALDHEGLFASLWAPANRAMRAVGRLDGLDAGSPVLRPIWLREARSSSAIENTVATAEEVALVASGLEFEHAAPREVHNNLRALEHGLSSPLPLSRRLLLEMHALLLEGVRGGDLRPGEFRTGPVYIGNAARGFSAARFVPPPGPEVERLIGNLERFVNEPPEELGELLTIGIAHYQFEAIHPFRDGNGRLGRLLISHAMCKHGLLRRPLVSVSSYIDAHRPRYYELLLRVSTHGDWGSWLEFFVEAVGHEAADTARRSGMLTELRADYLRRLGESRVTERMEPLVDALFERPATTAALVSSSMEVTDATARRYIDRFVEAGILTEVTGRDYAKRYVAPEIIELIERDLPEA